MPPATGQPPARGNVLTRRVGPLPAWVWIAILAAVILIWAFIARRKAAANASGTSAQGAQPPVVEQFQITTPPEQVNVSNDSDDDDDDPHKKHKRTRPRLVSGLVSGQAPGGTAPKTGNPGKIGKPGLPGGFGAPVTFGRPKHHKKKRKVTFLPGAGG